MSFKTFSDGNSFLFDVSIMIDIISFVVVLTGNMFNVWVTEVKIQQNFCY